MDIGEFDLKKIVDPLQNWFFEHGRLLPWRVKLPGRTGEGMDEADPYKVWVSEIMLQQTRVETVKPYYLRFIRRLPDVQTLAGCPQQELLKLWEGLGYYSRARNMKTAAQQIVEDYGGEMPGSFEKLLDLKGIGRYTAGAIASISYGEPVPAVDGNVLRVLSRVAADSSDIGKQSVKNHVEESLRRLMEDNYLPEKEGEPDTACTAGRVLPRIFNQALMDLGAMVCVPRGKPDCGRCPWGAFCLARKKGIAEHLPVKSKPAGRKIEKRTVFVIRCEGKVAIGRRPEQGLLAGMYEFPACPGHLEPETVMEEIRQWGMTPVAIRRLPEAKHIFSHLEWQMRGYEVEVVNAGTDRELLFLEESELRGKYAIPSAFSAYMKLLADR